jgi:rhodanese-related sulfurtransferase
MAISEISVDELDERLAEGAHLVDVRLPHEFEESHVAGAVLVPLPTVPDNVEAFRRWQLPRTMRVPDVRRRGARRRLLVR